MESTTFEKGIADESSKALLSNKPELQSLIVINKLNFPDASLLFLEDKNAIALDIPNYLYVDLISIDRTEDGIAQWLSEHDKYINFQMSYPLIETSHNLRHKIDLSVVAAVKEIDYIKLTWRDLYFKMNMAGVPADVNFDYYFRLKDTGNSIDIDCTPFNMGDIIYSLPLFRSIIFNHALDDNTEIAFSRATLRGVETIFIRVKNGDKLIGYYDFTHRPPMTIISNNKFL